MGVQNARPENVQHKFQFSHELVLMILSISTSIPAST